MPFTPLIMRSKLFSGYGGIEDGQQVSGQKAAVQVAVRIRPFVEKEIRVRPLLHLSCHPSYNARPGHAREL